MRMGRLQINLNQNAYSHGNTEIEFDSVTDSDWEAVSDFRAYSGVDSKTYPAN